jgi:hypothetical protein
MGDQNVFTDVLNFWVFIQIVNAALHNLVNLLDIFLWGNDSNLVLQHIQWS